MACVNRLSHFLECDIAWGLTSHGGSQMSDRYSESHSDLHRMGYERSHSDLAIFLGCDIAWGLTSHGGSQRSDRYSESDSDLAILHRMRGML